MTSLYAEAAACTHGEERARTLLESIQVQMAELSAKRLEMATNLTREIIHTMETRAVEIDGLLESGATTTSTPTPTPFVCLPLATLEAMDKNFSREWGWTLFKEAVCEGDVATVDMLIRSGMDPSVQNNWAIVVASVNGHLSLVDRLLQDARVDPSANDNFAINQASENDHLPVVNRLLQDARVNPSACKNRAIKSASRFGHLYIVDRLLQDARVDPTKDSNYAIQLAFKHNHHHVLERLLRDDRVTSSLSDKRLATYRERLS